MGYGVRSRESPVPAGQVFSGANPLANTVTVTIGGQPYHGSLYQEIGTNTVTCTSNWQTEVDTSTHPYTYWDRTGTAMLGVTPTNSSSGVTAPVTISAKLVGEGFNAVAFGLLLP